jgi:magnesium chelatase subunit H
MRVMAASEKAPPNAEASPPVRVAMITLDTHVAGVVAKARAALRADYPGLEMSLHAAVEFAADADALRRCHEAIAAADIIIVTLLFLDDHIKAVMPQLLARREHCDAMVCALSSPEVARLTRMGALRMDAPDSPLMAMLKKLRGKARPETAGAQQMAMLRRLPKILRFFPGKAQDVGAYFTVLQCWLAASEGNVAHMTRHLITRYAAGPRQALQTKARLPDPEIHPDVGLYHPRAARRIMEDAADLPAPLAHPIGAVRGRVGLLLMRSYVLAGDTAHYDAMIGRLEAAGLEVVPAFASGLDQRPAVEKHFMAKGRATVDAVLSLSGFSLVGGPAYNDADGAVEALKRLDVPFIGAHALEFQTLETWGRSTLGLAPFESTLMVAIPELDGAVAPMVFGGRSDGAGRACEGCPRGCVFPANDEVSPMRPCAARIATLADRIARLVTLRRTARAERKVGVVLYNFPPNAGATGSAAYLGVFESLWNTLRAMKADGYDVEVPANVDALRDALLIGNAPELGAEANVHARVSADEHVRREVHLRAIEAQWGPAPGRHQVDGRGIRILGRMMGKVFVGVQPAFGHEGDPMRLLYEKDCAPTHAFSAFYRWLREDFGAHALVHFGMHGALEFMPGKQVGMTDACWPERLIGDVPNIYLYAANNPSEGAIARRRSGATLVSYLTPPVAHSGLYRGLADLKASLDRWRACPPSATAEREGLAPLIHDQAAALDLAEAGPSWTPHDAGKIEALVDALREVETALIPDGLHVVGETASPEQRLELLRAIVEGREGGLAAPVVEAIAGGATAQAALKAAGLSGDAAALSLAEELARANAHLSRDSEIEALLHALDGGYIAPVPGGDLIRTPNILPTGRNITGFDPFRIPSAYALKNGAAQARRLVERHRADTGDWPRTVAIVLWGTDNLKTEGGPIGQALWLLGAAPRFDSYGRLAGADLLPLETLGRPRFDVMATPSGIFRDLLPLHMRMLAEAARLAALADEPESENFVRANALAHAAALGCTMETAALRVFSHDDGAYGVNVNHLIDAGVWSEECELADQFEARTCFSHDREGRVARYPAIMRAVMATVDVAYQNLDSVDLGITTIDHYVDMLGGVAKAVERARGSKATVYIGDETQGTGKVRTLGEQVELESRTRTLNPRWFEGQLRHGYEGVRQIEAQVTNTMGWSATTGQVRPWVYQRISETYVLDEAMRRRLGELNPKASLRLANRLLEAHARNYWSPDEATLDALRNATDEFEDRLENVAVVAA